MTKQIYKLKTKHRTWTLEVYDRPDAVHVLNKWKGRWVYEEELQYADWLGNLPLPWGTKTIITTFHDTKETIAYHPNGMIVRERPGLPTEVTVSENYEPQTN